MSKIISCCGVVCSECEYFPTDCQGCPEIQGKPFWLDFTGETICSIYKCCIIEKKYPHCGKCEELPCDFHEKDDPTKTPEENTEDHRKQISILKSRMNYLIREMKPEEYLLLTDFLYEAIFQRDEDNLLPKSVINEPALKIYIEDFGRKDDHCLCAEVNGKIVGAVWTRIISGFGSIDENTPEFAISLYKEYRGYGIGSAMMRDMVTLLKMKDYKKASLAVQKDNYALKMYQKAGFEIVDENEQEYIMVHFFE